MDKWTAAMDSQGLTWGRGALDSSSRAFPAVVEFFGTLNIFMSLRMLISEW